MALKLRISRYGNQPMGASAEHSFDERGGTIGRASSNDWVLPDAERIVSGRHAVISFANGEYRIRDTSTNGTYLNASAVPKGDERPIRDGDQLKIGPYEISATVEESGDAIFAAKSEPSSAADGLSGTGINPIETLDPLELLNRSSRSAGDLAGNFNPPSAFEFSDRNAQSDHSSPEAMGFELPRSIPDPNPPPAAPLPPGGIPENWDETGMSRSDAGKATQAPAAPQLPPDFPADTPPPAAPRVRISSPDPSVTAIASSGDEKDAVFTLLRGAGVPADMVTPETYAALGQILQVVVGGMVEVLRARAQIKDQFRVPATMMKPVENNPLKFSINAEDALHNLFGKRNPGFQSPVAAFRESFDDIKAHQMAMLAGMRAAYAEMLEYFDPEILEREFDKGLKRNPLAGVLNKTKYWELYEDLYKSLTRDSDSSFHRLFGDAFGRAYEDQMQRLSAMRKR